MVAEHCQRIVITPGEPAGIGPELVIAACQKRFANAELTVIADSNHLYRLASNMQLPLRLYPFVSGKPRTHQAGQLCIIDVPTIAPVTPGELNQDNAAYVMHCLNLASDYCLKQVFAALTTGPVHKGILNNAGFNFSGHTELLAQRANSKQVVMLFVTSELRLALATTHLPLAMVPQAITSELLSRVLKVLNHSLIHNFNIDNPRIAVAGLNPHAGEQGHLGREEIDIIAPCLTQLRNNGLDLVGPLSADTIFTSKIVGSTDAILAMYHDQGLPVIKQLGFGKAVNITLGLPYIRTSVDHGTALELAGSGQGSASSFIRAITMAATLSHKSGCLLPQTH